MGGPRRSGWPPVGGRRNRRTPPAPIGITRNLRCIRAAPIGSVGGDVHAHRSSSPFHAGAVVDPQSGPCGVRRRLRRPRSLCGGRRLGRVGPARRAPQSVAWRAIGGFDLSAEDRKDAFAGTFFRLYERLDTIREPAKLPGLGGHHRPPRGAGPAAGRRRDVPVDLDDTDLPPSHPDPGARLLDLELHEALHRGLARLSGVPAAPAPAHGRPAPVLRGGRRPPRPPPREHRAHPPAVLGPAPSHPELHPFLEEAPMTPAIPLGPDDDDLLVVLGEALDALDPVPADALVAARSAVSSGAPTRSWPRSCTTPSTRGEVAMRTDLLLEARSLELRRRRLPAGRRAARRRPGRPGAARPGGRSQGGAGVRGRRVERRRTSSDGSASPAPADPYDSASPCVRAWSSPRGSPGEHLPDLPSRPDRSLAPMHTKARAAGASVAALAAPERGARRQALLERSWSDSISGAVAASGTGSTGATTEPTPKLSSAAAVPSSSSPGRTSSGRRHRRAGPGCPEPIGAVRARRP